MECFAERAAMRDLAATDGDGDDLVEDPFEEIEQPPVAVAPDERRMQLRAYDLWTRLLGNGALPAIGDLRPGEHPSLSPWGVLLDFRRGRQDPHIGFLGASLAAECGVSRLGITRVSELPERSLLGRIAEHYLKALDSAEPIGFEAEFVNQRDRTILYRGILLPFSRDHVTIDYVFGVINWKELADSSVVEELLLDLAQSMGTISGGEHELEDAVSGSLEALPTIGDNELDAIDAAGGEVALIAIGRSGAGDPVVLGRVKRGSSLFGRAVGRFAG